jgi:hypothetical protein
MKIETVLAVAVVVLLVCVGWVSALTCAAVAVASKMPEPPAGSCAEILSASAAVDYSEAA